ncbi:hypothetical protein B0T14DRAFT_183880 [Immersiella caudata]|uniref:Uncharacterized protein n=1 Tax=Immersiella caudata TaxID=314043 RepID=A0AA39WXP6_9PEZI|nr:hypothetical protein B0T14DRAFT_183880 [Immersiella caudata]
MTPVSSPTASQQQNGKAGKRTSGIFTALSQNHRVPKPPGPVLISVSLFPQFTQRLKQTWRTSSLSLASLPAVELTQPCQARRPDEPNQIDVWQCLKPQISVHISSSMRVGCVRMTKHDGWSKFAFANWESRTLRIIQPSVHIPVAPSTAKFQNYERQALPQNQKTARQRLVLAEQTLAQTLYKYICAHLTQSVICGGETQRLLD